MLFFIIRNCWPRKEERECKFSHFLGWSMNDDIRVHFFILIYIFHGNSKEFIFRTWTIVSNWINRTLQWNSQQSLMLHLNNNELHRNANVVLSSHSLCGGWNCCGVQRTISYSCPFMAAKMLFLDNSSSYCSSTGLVFFLFPTRCDLKNAH